MCTLGPVPSPLSHPPRRVRRHQRVAEGAWLLSSSESSRAEAGSPSELAAPPLQVAEAPCPNCNSLVTVYFGDLFNVQTDDVLGKGLGDSSPKKNRTRP